MISIKTEDGNEIQWGFYRHFCTRYNLLIVSSKQVRYLSHLHMIMCHFWSYKLLMFIRNSPLIIHHATKCLCSLIWDHWESLIFERLLDSSNHRQIFHILHNLALMVFSSIYERCSVWKFLLNVDSKKILVLWTLHKV